MFGITLAADWMVRHLSTRLRAISAFAKSMPSAPALAALPFAVNVLTHSRQRYRRNLRFMPMSGGCRSAVLALGA